MKCNENKKNNNFVDEYEAVRIWAIILVVIGHCSTLALTTSTEIINPYDTLNLFVPEFSEQLRRLIYSFHMPLFVILSGAVFVISFDKQECQLWLKKRMVKLFSAYWLTAAFLLFPIRLIVNYYNGRTDYITIIYHDFILAYDPNYLWFVYMLVLVSIFIIVLKDKILSDNILNQFYLANVLLFISAGQFLMGMLPFQIDHALRFLFWFYVGVLIEKYRIIIKKKSSISLVLLVFVIWILFYGIHSYLELLILNNYKVEVPLFVIKCIKMIARYIMEFSGSFLLIIIAMISNFKFRGFVQLIGKRSFYIYLYHCPCIMLFKQLLFLLVPLNFITNTSYFCLLLVEVLVGLFGSLIIDSGIESLKNKSIIIKRIFRY